MRILPLLAGLLALTAMATPVRAQLRIGIQDDPDILDPTFSRTYVGTVVMTALCDKLFDFDANLNIVPVLATSYEWADTKTLLIHLRPGVTFQDNEKFDAAAVAYTLQRHLTETGSFRHSEISAMDHAEPVDDLTVRVVMKQPFSPFVAILTDRAGMMLPPRATRDGGKDFGLHPVCAGPFRFVDRVAQDHITLERFPGYWNAARIHYDRVTYRIIPDSSVRLANLQAGALDVANIAPLDADSVKRDTSLNLITVQSLGYGALTINTGAFPKAETPLGRDPRVRRAFELSIDRAALSQVVFAGMYTPNAQATSALSPLYDPSIKPPGARRGKSAGAAEGSRGRHTAGCAADDHQHAPGRAGRRGDPVDGSRGRIRRPGQRDGIRRRPRRSASRRLRGDAGRLVGIARHRQQRLEFPAQRRRAEHGALRQCDGGCQAGCRARNERPCRAGASFTRRSGGR